MVQKILEENTKTERRRLAESENRTFLLSGFITCGECARPLSGQSANGKNSVHRCYYHSYKRGVKIECSQKRVRADDIEQVVMNHLVEAAGRAGLLEKLVLVPNGLEVFSRIDECGEGTIDWNGWGGSRARAKICRWQILVRSMRERFAEVKDHCDTRTPRTAIGG